MGATTSKLEFVCVQQSAKGFLFIGDKPMQEEILECGIVLRITVQLIQSCFKQSLV